MRLKMKTKSAKPPLFQEILNGKGQIQKLLREKNYLIAKYDEIFRPLLI